MTFHEWDIMLRKCLLAVQLAILIFSFGLIAMVIIKRKCKTISTSMWTILVTIIVGSIILNVEVLLQYLNPTVPLCLSVAWLRELGFVICYGSIDLKLYRILMQFRTRKAHCWTIRDKDLLRYLSFAVIVVIIYLASWTAVSLNFLNDGWKLLVNFQTEDKVEYVMCKPQWWNHVTDFGEIMILGVGIYYGHSARNARVQFDERHYLFYAITVELTVSTIYNAIRATYPKWFNQDVKFVAAVIRGLLTNNLVLIIIFAPKVWYQKKLNAELRIASMNQELSESIKTDTADKDLNEMNISEMSPDEIREEFNRVYVQMGILRDKTVIKLNQMVPEVEKCIDSMTKIKTNFFYCLFSERSQKKGSRDKTSIKNRKKYKDIESSELSETNETNEVSKSPEDSVVSNEDALASGSGHSNVCTCNSTTGIHQAYCNECSDFVDNIYGEGPSCSTIKESA